MRRTLITTLLVAAAACGGKPSSSTRPTGTGSSPTGALSETEFKALHQLRGDDAPPAKGETIDLAGTRAYLSLPAGKGPFPGLIVIHEWWGLNSHIQHWADRLASAGYAALAVDLYGGKVATTPDEAMALIKAVDEAAAAKTLAAGLDFLKTDPRVQAPKRGVIGWCFGGMWSLRAALAHPDLDAAVIYYGSLETDPAKLKAIKAKILGIFANKDTHITPASVDAFEAGLAKVDVKHSIHRYDADHAFGNPSGPRYDEAAAADAWDKVLAFLAQTLK